MFILNNEQIADLKLLSFSTAISVVLWHFAGKIPDKQGIVDLFPGWKHEQNHARYICPYSIQLKTGYLLLVAGHGLELSLETQI